MNWKLDWKRQTALHNVNIWIWSIMKQLPILYEEKILSNLTSTTSLYADTKHENFLNDGIFLLGLSFKYEGE